MVKHYFQNHNFNYHPHLVEIRICNRKFLSSVELEICICNANDVAQPCIQESQLQEPKSCKFP